MPNRNTFDDREKYDHSSHRTGGREKGDLAPAPNQEEIAKTKNPGTLDPTRSPGRRRGAGIAERPRS
jgi:hypothetical protein